MHLYSQCLGTKLGTHTLSQILTPILCGRQGLHPILWLKKWQLNSQGQGGARDSAERWQEIPLESWMRGTRHVPCHCWERRGGHWLLPLPLDVAEMVLLGQGARGTRDLPSVQIANTRSAAWV